MEDTDNDDPRPAALEEVTSIIKTVNNRKAPAKVTNSNLALKIVPKNATRRLQAIINAVLLKRHC